VPEPDPKRRRPGTEIESGTPGDNSDSIDVLLNAAEQIAAEGQQFPSVRSLTPDQTDLPSPDSPVREEIHPLDGEEVHATAGGQPESWSNRAGSTGPESQAEVPDHHRERSRVDSFPSLDPSLSKPSIRPVYKQVEVTEETNLGNTEAQVVSDMKIAIMAKVDKLQSTLGVYLFKGKNASRIRH
jgi:hypothetical protein